MFIEQSHNEVYGCLKGGSGNSEGKRLAISMVEEAWLSEKEENGNSKKSLGRDSKGGIIILPPFSFEEHVAVQRETKARTLLLQSLPKDHM
nr:hypothetical protein [Tanacetum cinerariifolium]